MSGRILLAAAMALFAFAVLAVIATDIGPAGRVSALQKPVADALSDSQRADVRRTVRRYLVENPSVIVEVMEVLQARRQAAEQAQSKQALIRLRDALVASSGDPTLGPDNAAVTIVEFFDYQCPYCKSMTKTVMTLLRENDDLRLVFKEFPILGDASIVASRAALAAVRQNKYAEFHIALMNHRGKLSEADVETVARKVGLDLDRLRNDMQAPEVTAVVQENYQLAQAIGITGTPAFVIGDELVPGAVDADRLRALIEKARNATD